MFVLIGIAISGFCLFVARHFFRLASATRKKSVFLGACICFAGTLSVAIGFLFLGLAPVDRWGNSNEPTWVDHLMQMGFAGLAVGYCITKWRTRLFFRTVLGISLVSIGTLSTVQAMLPTFLKALPILLGVLVMSDGARVRSLSQYEERSRSVSSEFDV